MHQLSASARIVIPANSLAKYRRLDGLNRSPVLVLLVDRCLVGRVDPRLAGLRAQDEGTENRLKAVAVGADDCGGHGKAAVALANTIVHTGWAMLTQGTEYHRYPVVA